MAENAEGASEIQEGEQMRDLIRREDAIHILACEMYAEAQAEGYEVGSVEDYIPEAKAWMSDAPSAEPKTDGVFVKGGLTISGEPPMPEGCMDCMVQDRCLCIPPDLSADEISELYISRRPNCPLSMVAEPKTGEWVLKEHLWECDQCGCRINRANPLKGNIWNYNFCPNCGARMRGEEE